MHQEYVCDQHGLFMNQFRTLPQRLELLAPAIQRGPTDLEGLTGQRHPLLERKLDRLQPLGALWAEDHDVRHPRYPPRQLLLLRLPMRGTPSN